GAGSTASGNGSTAVGFGATASNAGDVALGSGSVTAGPNPTSGATIPTGGGNSIVLTGFAGTNPTSVVSVGSVGNERQVTNVAAGQITSTSTDAVNGSQLYALGNVVNTAVNGGGIKYFHANSTAADSTAAGAESVAIGPQANSGGTNSVAMGNGANTSANNAMALGAGSSANLANSVAVGTGSKTTASSDTAGNASVGVFNNAGAQAAGSGNVFSVGAVGAERQVQNVAAGAVTATSTDAVNGSQLYSVASNVGMTSPTYKLNGSTKNYTNVLSGVQDIANGAAGPLQYTTPGTPSNDLQLVGTGGPVVLHNVAPGEISATSTQAINGSQLYALGTKIDNSVQYSTTQANTVVFNSPTNGGNVGAPVTLTNVAPGAVTPTSTDAINGSQLYQTNQAINNLAAYTTEQIRKNEKIASAGTASALAASGLRYDDRPGRTSIAGAVGYYRSQLGVAFGAGYTSQNGRVRVNAAVTIAPTLNKPEIGAVVGASFSLD
ncbi:hypothetical protein DWF00_19750, partial [Bosea caraganae]